jgi:hypothetical protein
MAVTVAGTTFDRLHLTSQPFGYDAQEATRGYSARQWTIEGFLDGPDFITLTGIYDGWRNSRLTTDTKTATTVGTTVSFSATGPGGVSWSGVGCWFNSPPAAEQAGKWLKVTFSLVDATQKLQAELAQKIAEAVNQSEIDEVVNEAKDDAGVDPDYGTTTVGSVSIKLTKPEEGYGPGPELSLTASGVHLVTGPPILVRARNIEGEVTSSDWNNIRSWYESIIVTTPSSGSYFPVTPPTISSAERRTINNVVTDVYTITMQLILVI